MTRPYAVSIEFLPPEVVSLVLTKPDLSFRDVVNFGRTCKRFHAITNDNELWKVKLLKRWPCLLTTAEETNPSPVWLDQCKKLHPLSSTVIEFIGSLSAQCFHKDEVSYSCFSPLKELSLSGPMSHSLVIGILRDIVFDKEEHKHLTAKYYAKKALRYIHHVHMKTEWQKFLALPIEQQSLLEGALLFERWYSPFSSLSQEQIRREVTEIANQARRKLTMEHPCYPGNSEGVVEMTSNQCYEVLDAVNEVMYKEMGFKGNSDDYYNKGNSFISQVLSTKLGIPITLCILYEAVVRRLGVVLRPVNFPGHFLLQWNYTSDGFKDTDTNLFIDAFKEGHIMTTAEAFMQSPNMGQFGYSPNFFHSCVPRDVFKRMATNMLHINQFVVQDSELYNWYGEELQAVLNPEDFETVMDCVKFYIQRRVHFSESLEMIREIRPQNDREANGIRIILEIIHGATEQQQEDNEQPSPKHREENKEVKYSVGMVMRHRRYHYACVIYGWDPVCKLSREWQRQMGVHQLPLQEKQPFYNVIVEDKSSRYAAQENLDFIDAPVAISHPEIGRYFEEFTPKCYLPNEQLAQEYPDDTAITTEKVNELYTE